MRTCLPVKEVLHGASIVVVVRCVKIIALFFVICDLYLPNFIFVSYMISLGSQQHYQVSNRL